MVIFKVIIVGVGWVLGFIASRKYRQIFLAIPAAITIVILFVDNSSMENLKESLSSLIKSYTPIEKTALEHYPNLQKQEAIKKYLEDFDKMKVDNQKLKEEQAKHIQKIKILEDKNTDLEIRTSEQQEHQKIIKEFSVVASWNHKGETESGGGVNFSGPLSGWLNKFVTEQNGGISWQCNQIALDNYKKIIEKYPKYPFPYLYIALCLKKAQDPSWKDYATKGLEIFKKTTMVPQHTPSHESGLKMIKEALEK
jgi:hypothetical protein